MAVESVQPGRSQLPGRFVFALDSKFAARLSMQPNMRYTHPELMVAVGLKLSALEAVQPRWTHEPSSMFRLSQKLLAVESVQPARTSTQPVEYVADGL